MSEGIIVGAIEIGTAKVVVAIGEVISGQSLNILGIGEAPSQGVKKGEVVDFQAASTVVHAAIMAAEKTAGVSLQGLFLAQTGAHLSAFYNEGWINVTASDNRVSQNDIERVVQDAKGKELPSDRVYIHHIQNPFKLDGRIISNPYGMAGKKLQVGYWSVHGDTRKVRDHIHVINGFGLKVEDIIISSIASGSMIASEVEKQNGVLAIDIGRGTTDYAVYSGGYLIHTGVLPVGGDHITNDLSLGLRIDHKQAESIKVNHANLSIDSASDEKVWLEGEGLMGERTVKQTAIMEIVNARVEEIFNVIVSSLEGSLSLSELSAGVILTGGTSRLPGIDTVAAKVFTIDARLGENPPWASQKLRDPEYSTILGLLHYALKSKDKTANISVKKNRILHKVAKIFNLT